MPMQPVIKKSVENAGPTELKKVFPIAVLCNPPPTHETQTHATHPSQKYAVPWGVGNNKKLSKRNTDFLVLKPPPLSPFPSFLALKGIRHLVDRRP